jgi:hypothetical protein
MVAGSSINAPLYRCGPSTKAQGRKRRMNPAYLRMETRLRLFDVQVLGQVAPLPE